MTYAVDGMKRCGHCKKVRPVAEFTKSKDRKDGLYNNCRSCCHEVDVIGRHDQRAAYRLRMKEHRRRYNIEYRKGHQEQCKARSADYYKRNKALFHERYMADPGRHLAYLRRRKYGATSEWVAETLAAQRGQCAICGLTFTGKTRKTTAAVDHCHRANGKPRGLLCCNCNLGLGHFLDSSDFLRSAADYLDRNQHG